MQTKHYFHELTDQEKKFYFSKEVSATSPRVRLLLAIILTIIGITDLILRLWIYPLLEDGKVYPFYKPTIIPWAIGIFSFILNLIRYPRISEKCLSRIRHYLGGILVLSGGCYYYLMTFDFLTRAVQTKTPEDWTFSILTISNCVHQTVFIMIISPTWAYTVFSLAGSYAAVITVYVQADEPLKEWVIVKSVANILYMTAYMAVGSYARWKAFIKSSEAEAWNQVYNDTLDRIPSSIAVMNISGKLIYSNLEFKKNAENNPEKLFKSITNLKLRDLTVLSTEGLPRTSLDDFGPPSSDRKNLGSLNGSPYFLLKTREAISPNSARFNRLEDLLEHYRTMLANNELRNEEPMVYDSRIEVKTLYHHHVYSYEVIIRPLVEYKKIVIILNNTTQRDLLISLEDNNTYKDKLLASISHELRTPLNGNLVLLQAAVQEEGVPKSVKEKLLMPALRSGRLLSHLINDILDYSTMLADKVTLYCETRPIRESLEYCCQLLEHVFKAKQLKFDLIIDPSVPTLFHTDHQRLIQVILNLLSNALKFTYNGAVTVEARVVKEDPSAIEISVTDTGIGISKEGVSRLFEEDLLTTSREAVTSKGVGLGLKVASKLVKMLGSEDGDGLQVNSVDGEGSVFWFRIVQKQTGEEEEEADEEKLMDELERSRSSLSTIPGEISGDNREIGEEKFKIPKFVRNMSKSCAKIDIQRDKVLIVDDDLINILALEILLKQLKIDADTAYNGKQAIEKVIAHPNKYKIIFMDCQMPIMDGFEATRQLVEKMKSKEVPIIPIVGCTAFSAKDKVEECIKSGMMEVIHKPVLKEKLKEILEEYVGF